MPTNKAPDLSQRLPGVGTARVVTVLGPPGSGKSTLLEAWAHSWRGRLAILDCTPESTGLTLTRELDLQLDHSAKQAPHRARSTHAVLETLGKRPTLILFDRAELGTHHSLPGVINALLRSQPASTTVVIAGRRLPELRWSKLRLTGRLTEVRAVDLERYTHQLIASSLDSRRQALAGDWAAGARELAQAPDPVDATTLEPLLRSALARISDVERRQLEAAAIVGPLSAASLEAATGRGSGEALFERLRHEPLPMVQLTADPSPHLVVRGALREILAADAQSRDPAALVSIVQNAPQQLVREGADDIAFQLLLRHADRGQLVEFAYQRSAHVALAGRPELAATWLAEFTPDEISDDARLRVLKTIADASTGNFSGIDALVQRVVDAPDDAAFPWNRPRSSASSSVVVAASRQIAADSGQAAWIVFGQMNAAAEALEKGEFAQAEGVLNHLSSMSGGYPFGVAWRCALQGQLYSMTGRESLGAAQLEQGEAVLRAHGLSDHPWMIGLDAAALPYSMKRGDARSVGQRSALIQAKLPFFVAGYAHVRLYSLLMLARAQVWQSKLRQASASLTLAQPLASSLVEGSILRTQYDALRASVPVVRRSSDPGVTHTELRVLRALPSHSTIPRIAESLGVEVATIRSHVRSLHRKLQAHDREETIARARELGLLP